jgi:hypothetical protein
MGKSMKKKEPRSDPAHDGSRSSEKEEASLLVMDTEGGTCKGEEKAVMRVSRIAGDNGEHTDKVASVAIDEEEQQMESVNWDPCELRNFFDSYIDKLASTPPDDNAESWAKIEQLEGVRDYKAEGTASPVSDQSP